MICLDFDWQIDEFMVYCRSSQLRLFERWYPEQTDIFYIYSYGHPTGCNKKGGSLYLTESTAMICGHTGKMNV